MSDGIPEPVRAEATPAEKRARLKELLARRAGRSSSAPLSAGQERLWALEAIDPGNLAYVETGSLRFSAQLDLRFVQRALDELVARHAILRTTFAIEDGAPVQRIARESSVRLEIQDLRGHSPGEQDASLRALLREISQHPFDLERGPLLRCKLLRLGEKDHIVLVAIHHIICDGSSIRLLLSELFELYLASRMGRASSLGTPAAQYADYARWQRQWLESAAIEPELDYWRRTLAGPLPVVQLPPDRPARGAARRFRGAQLRFRIPDALHTALRARATEHNATPFMFLLAAFDVLLHAYTGGEDIIVATPVAGRNRPEYERVIGFFVNTLVLRSDLSGNPTFRELLARVREATLGAMAHQEVPIESIARALNVPRNRSHTPLVQVGFALHPAWTDQLDDAARHGVEVLDLDSGTSRMELTVMLWQGKTALTGTVEYDTDLYDASTVERFIDHYVRLIDAVVADLDRRVFAELPIEAAEADAVAQRRERWRRAPRAVGTSSGARDLDAEIEELCERTNLTRNQMLVWLGQRAQPGVPLYNIPMFYHLDMDVEIESFRRAFQSLVDATEALRTVFDEVDGLPRRRVLPRFEVEVPLIDLSLESDPDAAFEAFAEKHRGVRFDPSRPLFEAALLVLGPRRFVWYINQHHLIGDGWSVSKLVWEKLGELYRKARAGEPLEFELPGFDDFAREELARRGSAPWERAREHWRAVLSQPPPPLWFYARSLSHRTTRVQRTSCPLGAERAARLLAAARELGAASDAQALYQVVASALFAWLHRASGNRRLAVGSPLLNRSGPRDKATAGLFMNVVPLAITVDPEDTFRSLAGKVARELKAAMRHQFYAVVNPSERPFYEVGLNVHLTRAAPFDGKPIRGEWRHPGHEHEALAVQVRNFVGSGELTLEFDTREDRFDVAEARRSAHALVAVLDAWIADPDLSIAALEIPDAAERRHLIEELNRTASVQAADVIEAFHRAVDRFPSQVAVVGGDDEISYRALEARVNRLANFLAERGVGPDDHVAVLAARSADFVVGVLGALSAGAAYVPIDAAHPEQRIAEMIERSGARVVLVQQACAERLRDGAAQLVALDGSDCPWAASSAERLSHRGDRERSGYVIFTSGSTGSPHAVVVSAASLAHYAATAAQLFGLEPSDRVLHFAALSFDTAVEEIFPTLISGATLVLRDDAMLAVPGDFLARCGERSISVVNLPTSYWNAVVDRTPAQRRAPASIRLVVVGGERMLPERLRAWRRGPGRGLRLLNGYGPTETTVVATFADLSDADPPASARTPDVCGSAERPSVAEPPGTVGLPAPVESPDRVEAPDRVDLAAAVESPSSPEEPVSIGRPIAGARVYILDERMRPLPKGMVGELWIGGAGVARGYLGEPALTAERFRPDPFGPPGARLYRSGDWCRWGEDGELRFLGRIDGQLKVGGFRVEPGEVEAALLCEDEVRDAAVGVVEDGPLARLVAWVVASGAELDRVELRARLRARLPDFMVPSSIVAVASLPRLPNGKVDRDALHALADDRAETFVAPRDERERKLAAIWCQALGLDFVSVHADFFELGGDSLLAIRVTLLAERAGIRFAPRQLFERRTIAALAALREGSSDAAAPQLGALDRAVEQRCGLVTLAAGPRPLEAQRADEPGAGAAPLFIFHGAGGDLRPYRFLARELASVAPLIGIESSLSAGPGTTHDSIESMALAYCDLVRGRQARGPYRLLGWSMGGLLALEVARRIEAQGEPVCFLGLLDDSASAAPDQTDFDAATLAGRIGELMYVADTAPDAATDPMLGAATSSTALEAQAAQLIENLAALSAADRAKAAAAWLADRGLVSPGVPAIAIEERLRRFEEHGALCANYRPKPIEAPIHRWCTADSSRREPPSALVGAMLEAVEGNHYTMLFPPHVADLAARIRRALETTTDH